MYSALMGTHVDVTLHPNLGLSHWNLSPLPIPYALSGPMTKSQKTCPYSPFYPFSRESF